MIPILFIAFHIIALVAPSCRAQTTVKVGDSGTILFPVQNYLLSTEPLQGVRIATTGPSFFHVLDSSKLGGGTTTIAAGTTYQFQIDYRIEATSQNGYFDVSLTATADSPATITIPNTLPPSVTIPFAIDTSSPSCTLEDVLRLLLGNAIPATIAPLTTCSDFPAGICSIKLENPSGIVTSTADFANSAASISGPFPQLAVGTYTFIAEDCEGNVTRSTFSISASTSATTAACLGNDHYCAEVALDTMTVKASSMTISFSPDMPCYDHAGCMDVCEQMDVSCAPTCFEVPQSTTTPYPAGIEAECQFDHIIDSTFTIVSTIPVGHQILIDFDIYDSSNSLITFASTETRSYSWTILYGTVTAPDVGNTMKVLSDDGVVRLDSFFSNVRVSPGTMDSQMLVKALNRLLARIGFPYEAKGSDFMYSSGTLISFTTTIESGVTVDTTTLHIYRFDGVDWSSSSILNQYINYSNGVVRATGTTSLSGTYSLFYQGQDSTPPITALTITGSSFAFDSTVFLSTDSFVVLTATDPAVNGFASQVSTTYYRYDATSASDAFSVYTSSLAFLSGPHVLEFRSQDYAGNFETVQTSTFLVTSRDLLKATTALYGLGTMLLGGYPVGAQLAIQAWGVTDASLLISSPSKSAMFSASSFGNIGVGRTYSDAQVDVQGSSISADIALQLRSGNSTASATSIQIAFGFDGDTSMRHLLTTQHSTGPAGNRMDWWVWNPAAGSTVTLANLDVLAIQAIPSISGGALHVRPTGAPDVELEVSDGATVGGGTIHRLQAGTHSSRTLKSDIRYLNEAEGKLALADVLALRPAQFRYKAKEGQSPGSRLWKGLIFEDVPKSITGPGNAVILDDRVANLEMALQQSIQRLESLQRRLKEVQSAP